MPHGHACKPMHEVDKLATSQPERHVAITQASKGRRQHDIELTGRAAALDKQQ